MKPMKIINQQRSLEERNVQRLVQKHVPLNGETENILTSNVEDEDIVHNLISLSKLKNRNIELEKQIFLKRAYIKYGNKFTYDLSNFNRYTTDKIKITCNLHGEFEQIPHTFLLINCSTGCKKCGFESKNKSKTKDFSNFIENAHIIHNNKYEYIEENYENRKSKVKIVCKEHGLFIKSAQKHLSGQGCFKCRIKKLVENDILVGGYNQELFDNKPELKLKSATLYYLKINNGEFYKIGITIQNIKNRINALKSKSAKRANKFEVIWSVEDTLYNCYLKEQEILNNKKEYRIYTDWSTELFNQNIIPLKLNKLN